MLNELDDLFKDLILLHSVHVVNLLDRLVDVLVDGSKLLVALIVPLCLIVDHLKELVKQVGPELF